jgi:hypothetical protein
LELSLSREAIDAVSKCDDDQVALVAMDMFTQGLLPKLKTGRWKKSVNARNLYGEHWLFAYEACANGWFTGIKDFATADEFFGALRKQDFRFYRASKPDQTTESGYDPDAVDAEYIEKVADKWGMKIPLEPA